MHRAAAAALVAVLLLFSTAARGQEAQRATPEVLYQRALNYYRFGDYEQAVGLLNGLLSPRVLLQDGDQVREALEALGIASFLMNDPRGAREAFVRLLNLEPSSQLDPLIVPPQVIEFFNGIRKEMEETLAQLRARQQREAELQALAQAPTLLVQEQVIVDQHPYWLNFLPFGVGQFELGRRQWGWFFLTSQAAALGCNVTASLLVESTRNPDGTHGHADYVRARDVYQPLQVASLVTLGLLFAWSTIDSLASWRPEDRTLSRSEKTLPPAGTVPPSPLPSLPELHPSPAAVRHPLGPAEPEAPRSPVLPAPAQGP